MIPERDTKKGREKVHLTWESFSLVKEDLLENICDTNIGIEVASEQKKHNLLRMDGLSNCAFNNHTKLGFIRIRQ